MTWSSTKRLDGFPGLWYWLIMTKKQLEEKVQDLEDLVWMMFCNPRTFAAGELYSIGDTSTISNISDRRSKRRSLLDKKARKR
jgi:hypothetical protein